MFRPAAATPWGIRHRNKCAVLHLQQRMGGDKGLAQSGFAIGTLPGRLIGNLYRQLVERTAQSLRTQHDSPHQRLPTAHQRTNGDPHCVDQWFLDISNQRIVKLEDDEVTFWYTNRQTKRRVYITLPVFTFIDRFLQHVLPKGFVKVRYYGFLAPGGSPLGAAAACARTRIARR